MAFLTPLLALIPWQSVIAALLGYWFGPKAVSYTTGIFGTLYTDVTTWFTGLFAKKAAAVPTVPPAAK